MGIASVPTNHSAQARFPGHAMNLCFRQSQEVIKLHTGRSKRKIHLSWGLRREPYHEPTSYVTMTRRPGQTVDINGKPVEVVTTGRHDPCVGIRATPIAEAMLALVLMDHLLRHRAQNLDARSETPVIPPRAPDK